jgi:large exoprotein involved in heme utilization and adhesion
MMPELVCVVQVADIIVNTNIFTATNGGRLAGGTEGLGKGGDIIVNSKEFNISGNGSFTSGIFQQILPDASGNSGNIIVNASSLKILSGAQIQNVVLAGGKGNAGDITLNVSDFVRIVGTSPLGQVRSAVSSETQSSGNAGNLTINSRNLSIVEGAILSTGTFASNGGKGGNLMINASDLVEIVGASTDTSFRSAISSETQGSGDAGNLTINTRNLSIQGGGTVSTGTFDSVNGEQGGSLTVNNDSLTEIGSFTGNNARLSGIGGRASSDQNALLFNLYFLVQPEASRTTNLPLLPIATAAGGQYSANSLLIDALRKLLPNSPGNSTSSIAPKSPPVNTAAVPAPIKGGNGGALVVNASGSVELSGTTQPSLSDGEIRSSLNTVVGQNAQGQGGNLVVNAQRLSVRDGAGISVGTFGKGNAGKLNISTGDLVEVIGYSALGKSSELSASVDATARGQGGDLSIETGLLTATDRGAITVSSQGIGQGGNLSITARSIDLNNQGKLIAETTSGQGGNITLNFDKQLTLRNGGQISATAGMANLGGDGGNVIVNSPNGFLVAIPKENSDITANAFNGVGGKVIITNQGIFGLQYRPKVTSSSDITASSQFGSSGIVTLNAPDTNSLQNGLNQLPSTQIDTNRLLANSCIVRTPNRNNSFYITGSSSLPLRPGDAPVTPYPTGALQPIPSPVAKSPVINSATRPVGKRWKKGDPIVEPQDIYQLPDGQLILSRECH